MASLFWRTERQGKRIQLPYELCAALSVCAGERALAVGAEARVLYALGGVVRELRLAQALACFLLLACGTSETERFCADEGNSGTIACYDRRQPCIDSATTAVARFHCLRPSCESEGDGIERACLVMRGDEDEVAEHDCKVACDVALDQCVGDANLKAAECADRCAATEDTCQAGCFRSADQRFVACYDDACRKKCMFSIF
jgi:hypothetical protein